MKIVNISGGLGNQMFQYAFAIALKNKHKEEIVFIDTQHYHTIFFKKFKGINLHNGYEINKVFPKANLPIAGFFQLRKISYWIPNYILSRIGRKLLPIRKTEYIHPYSMNYTYDKKALENEGDCYYEGYWQSVHYFTEIKNELQEVYTHPEPNLYNKELILEIKNSNSVGIHVRRGDYLNEPEFQGICNIEYYKKAIHDIVSDGKNHKFYIFSNDIKWCKEKLAPLIKGHDLLFVTGNKGNESCWDMFLMTYCKNLIIANSSFSWWGAFLNKRVNRVYAPDPWLNRECSIDVYEENWIKVKIDRNSKQL